jgi:hypothetical protein
MDGVFAARAALCKRTFRFGVMCCLMSVLAGLAIARPALARTLEVGPGRALTGPLEAAAAARDGDRVVFDPGVYRECAIWNASHLTLEARLAPATMNRTVMTQSIVTGPVCGGRALFYFVGNDILVRGLSFQHARDDGHNGAGILMEGANLTVENSEFQDNEDGILTGGPANSVVRVRRSVFIGNGSCLGSCAHALYVGARIARLEVLGCVFFDTRVGHDIKSRARMTVARDNRIEDGPNGTSSYLIELPDGGDAEIVNNLLRKGVNSDNKEVAISIGIESSHNPTHSLDIRGNRFISDLPDPVRFVRNSTTTPARLANNTLIGHVIPLEGPGTVE